MGFKSNLTSPSQLVFLDVGQGSSMYVNYRNTEILIDAGPDDSVVYELSKLRDFDDRYIDLFILTHPHKDHLEGLLHLLRYYSFGMIIVNPVCYNSSIYEEFLASDLNMQFLNSDHKRLELIPDILSLELFSMKSSRLVGRNCDFDFQNDSVEGINYSNLNNSSIVTLIKVNDIGILNMGDAEKEVERYLLDSADFRNRVSEVTILSAGHHCSDTSSTKTFINYISPEVAVCSFGSDNRLGHPAEEVVHRFKRKKIKVFYTTEGSVKFEL